MRKAWLVIGSLAVGSAFAAACGNDAVTVGGGDDAGGAEASTPPSDGSAPPGDGGDDGGDIVNDGGANIDVDAGDDDAGADAGRCNAVLNDAPATVSTCISLVPQFTGGALVPGKHWLTGVAALGSQAFCQGTFIPVGFKETLDLAVTGGTATLNTAFEIGGPPVRHRTSTLTPGAGDTSPAAAQATCPALGAAGSVPYSSRVSPAGKQVVLALLPYGRGAAIYRFERQ